MLRLYSVGFRCNIVHNVLADNNGQGKLYSKTIQINLATWSGNMLQFRVFSESAGETISIMKSNRIQIINLNALTL